MNQKNEVWPNGMPEVGQTAQRSREVTSRDIECFTEISGDRNPLHYDEEAREPHALAALLFRAGLPAQS